MRTMASGIAHQFGHALQGHAFLQQDADKGVAEAVMDGRDGPGAAEGPEFFKFAAPQVGNDGGVVGLVGPEDERAMLLGAFLNPLAQPLWNPGRDVVAVLGGAEAAFSVGFQAAGVEGGHIGDAQAGVDRDADEIG